MLEEQSIVASFTCSELRKKLDLANLDALSLLVIQIQLTFWRSPAVNVHHLDSVVAVTIVLLVGALVIEVGSHGLMPRKIFIHSLIVVRHTLVLQLEWELVIRWILHRFLVCRRFNGARPIHSTDCVVEEGWSDDGCCVGKITTFKHLFLFRATHAVVGASIVCRFLWEALHSALERVPEEVPGAIASKALEAWHAKQVFRLLPVDEHLDGDRGQ